MPILVNRKCYKNFESAVRAVMRKKRIGKARASAYVATVERRQRGSKRVRKACG